MRGNVVLGETVAGLTGNAGTFITTDQVGAGLQQKLTIEVAAGNTFSFAGAIGIDASAFPIPGAGNAGNIAFTKTGAGTEILTGANTFTGATTLSAGSLLINGSLANTAGVSVANGALLGGSGSIATAGNGSVTLALGAKLSPGASPGTLTLALGTGQLDISAVGLANAQSLLFDLGTTSDEILLSAGTLNIGNGALGFADFGFTNAGGLAAGTYTLFDAASPITGTLDSANLSGPVGTGLTGTLSVDNVNNDIKLTVVPEPGAFISLLGGFGLLAGVRRFRRRSPVLP